MTNQLYRNGETEYNESVQVTRGIVYGMIFSAAIWVSLIAAGIYVTSLFTG